MKTRDSKANKTLRTAALSKNRMPALPVIALYYSEAKDIMTGVADDPEFHKWRDEFAKLFFTAGHFIISEKGKKEDQSMYFSFNAKSRTPHFTVFDHNGTVMTRFNVSVDDVSVIIETSEYTKEAADFALSVELIRINPFLQLFLSVSEPTKTDSYKRELDELDELDAKCKQIYSLPIMKGVNIYDSYDVQKKYAGTKSDAERNLIALMIQDILEIRSKQKKISEQMLVTLDSNENLRNKKIVESFQQDIFCLFCSTMYYFHIRVPKFVDLETVMTTEGYKKWNPDYNPIKRLQPPSVVRPRNGTRSYLEQQRQRRTESWHVRGHLRRYKKTGLEVWITPYVKGTGDGLRLSVYADAVAANDVVASE
jgi:hypothetical protein